MAKTALVEKPLAQDFERCLRWRHQGRSDHTLDAADQVVVVDLFNLEFDQVARVGPAVVDVGDPVDFRCLADRPTLEKQFGLLADPVDENLNGLTNQLFIVMPVDICLQLHDGRLPLGFD